MTDVTQILSQIEQGDPSAAEQLLPLVYEELRRLATQKMAQEQPGQTLQATALVHEADVRRRRRIEAAGCRPAGRLRPERQFFGISSLRIGPIPDRTVRLSHHRWAAY